MTWIECSYPTHDGDDNNPINLNNVDYFERISVEYMSNKYNWMIKFHFNHNYICWYYPSEHERNKNYQHIQDRIRDMQK